MAISDCHQGEKFTHSRNPEVVFPQDYGCGEGDGELGHNMRYTENLKNLERCQEDEKTGDGEESCVEDVSPLNLGHGRVD